MDTLGSWMDSAFRNKGLPFGSYLHSTPPKRQRSLTGPLDTSHDSFWHKIQIISTLEPEQHSYLQEQCAFLSLLPLDIRMIIYDLVLGGMTFHITTNEPYKTRILSYVCKHPERIDVEDHQVCYGREQRRPSSAPREDYAEATGLLPLLVTCRRIYSEAIDSLYSANTFDFWANRVAFRFLKTMIPPQRLHCIRRFRWDMQLPHHPNVNSRSRRDWSDLFTFFTNETSGLQLLHLKLNRNHPVEAEIRHTPDSDAIGWIQPIVLMAVESNRKRGCKFEFVTNGIIHEPDAIFKDIAHGNTNESYDADLEMACVELHRRIRISLEATE